MILRYIEICGIISLSPTILLGHMIEEPNVITKMIENPVIGKRYRMYGKVENWTMAKNACEKIGYELVQLPTTSEQKWIEENLAILKTYWVGATKAGKKFYWTVPNGKILVDMKRFFTGYYYEPKITAHEKHLHGSYEDKKNFIICQQEYSKDEGNFEKFNGRHRFGKMIKQVKGGIFQCAMNCMMSFECKGFRLDFLKGYCQLHKWFHAVNIHEDGINCNSSTMGCFARFKTNS